LLRWCGWLADKALGVVVGGGGQDAAFLPAVAPEKLTEMISKTRQRGPAAPPPVLPGRPLATVTEIRAALRYGSEFTQPDRYRWQFGRAAGPWRGRYPEPVE